MKTIEEIDNEIVRFMLLKNQLEVYNKDNKDYWQIEKCKSFIHALEWVKGNE